MTTVVDVLAAVAAKLAVAFDDPAVAVWPCPPDATALPAVWPELLNGGGVSGAAASLTPVTVRCVYVPAPKQNASQHAELAAGVDLLAAALAAPIAAAVVLDAASWTLDAVTIGGADYDAVLYDLALSHHLTC